MTDEEKKAIEKLKEYTLCKIDENGNIEINANSYKIVVLNLIEKQSKEIEELEKNRKVSQNFAKIVATDYISKDKIKAKIEEIKKKRDKKPKNEKESGFNFVENTQITILQSLLKEKE